MSRRLWVIVWVVAFVGSVLGVATAWAATVSGNGFTVTLGAGESTTVRCGGTSLAHARLSNTSVRESCSAAATTTTKPPSSTTTPQSTTTTKTPVTTLAPGETTTSQPPGQLECTSNPQGALGAYSYPGITMSNGYNTYIANQVWAPQPGTTSTVCGRDPGHWTLTTKTTQDEGGAVQSYPDVQQLMNNWGNGTWNNCGSTCADTPIAALQSLTSSFNITNPPTNQGAWWAAYDIWSSSGELMIITTGSDARLANNGATVLNPDVVVGGQHWTDMNYGGGLPQMVLHGNPASGTVDLLAVLKYWQSTGKVAANATIGQLNYGWEICSTNGQSLNFAVNGYTLTGS